MDHRGATVARSRRASTPGRGNVIATRSATGTLPTRCSGMPSYSRCARFGADAALLLPGDTLGHEHYGVDPATLWEDELRDYSLHVKTGKGWKPKTIRQTMACARLFSSRCSRTAIADPASSTSVTRRRSSRGKTAPPATPGARNHLRHGVRRPLCHVLPAGLRSIRRYGYCHPANSRSAMAASFRANGRGSAPPRTSLPRGWNSFVGLNTAFAESAAPAPWRAKRLAQGSDARAM